MEIVNPDPSLTPELIRLWQLAFGDSEDLIRNFFSTAFEPRRCRCLLKRDRPAAVLYWLDCVCRNRKLAYLYAVATHPEHRRQGLCHSLMADTRDHVTGLGYDGIVLMPAGDSQRRMYAGMGYRDFSGISRFSCTAGTPVPVTEIGPEAYGRLRRTFLPQGSVIQEGPTLSYLHTYARFYAGEDFVLAAAPDGDSLLGLELLGPREAGPGILAALGYETGTFRVPGNHIPFAMFLPLTPEAKAPGYFGLALD